MDTETQNIKEQIGDFRTVQTPLGEGKEWILNNFKLAEYLASEQKKREELEERVKQLEWENLTPAEQQEVGAIVNRRPI